jgi:hypothetical protein
MKTQDLILAHKYDEAIAGSRRQLLVNPADRAAIGWLSDALRFKGEYKEAIEWLERSDALRKEDKQFSTAAPGHPGSSLKIACLHWMLGDHSKAISQMHGLAAGILDSSIKYGDAAGGMKQGLLLYYMAITARETHEAAYALEYLRNRVLYVKTKPWPSPIAEYLLGDIAIESVLEEVERKPKLAVPDAAERIEKGRRFNLAEALFYDGVKSRVDGDEGRCLSRMREAYLLENQSNEWFFARIEVQQAGQNADSPE